MVFRTLCVFTMLTAGLLASTGSAADPAPAPTMEVKAFVTATEAEFVDLTSNFNVLFTKLATKPTTATGQAAPTKRVPKMTINTVTRSVIVRGTKADLDTVDLMVKFVQGTAPADANGGMQLIKLKHIRSNDMVEALGSLELAENVLALRNTNTLVLMPRSDTETAQIRKVVELFDIDPKSVAKTATTK